IGTICAWYIAMAHLLTKDSSYFILPLFPISHDPPINDSRN
ncbi:9602_t:CDS:1, partial [Cetraspora pellucida]